MASSSGVKANAWIPVSSQATIGRDSSVFLIMRTSEGEVTLDGMCFIEIRVPVCTFNEVTASVREANDLVRPMAYKVSSVETIVV